MREHSENNRNIPQMRVFLLFQEYPLIFIQLFSLQCIIVIPLFLHALYPCLSISGYIYLQQYKKFTKRS